MKRCVVSRLPLRVPYRAGEPGHGLLARLAARHEENDIRSFAADRSLSFDRVALGHDLDTLAFVAGLPAEPLYLTSPQIDAAARTVRLGKEVVRLSDWSPRGRRWCPRCLHEDLKWAADFGHRVDTATFHRFWWDVKAIGNCPLHGRPLQENCSECGSSVAWRGQPIHLCACGRSLASSQNHETRHDCHDDLYLVARLTGTDHPPVPLLDRIPLKDAICGIERLGLAILKPWSGPKPVVTKTEAKAARVEGMRVALAWETPFSAALDRLVVEARAREAPRGMIGTYGWIYEHWVSTLPDDTFGIQIKAVLHEHAIANGVVAEGESLLGQQGASDVIDITHAARAMGVSYKRMRHTLDRAGLMPRGARRGVAAPLSVSWVSEIKAAYERTIGMSGLRCLFGLGKTQTRRIVDAGLVKAKGGTPDEVDSGRFLLDEARDIVARVRQGVPQRRSIPTQAATLPSACRSVGVRIEVALSLILDGRISPIGVLDGSVGVSGVLIYPADLRRTTNKETSLTVEAAARELGIHHEVARFLVARRYLPVVADGTRRGIDQVGLRRFRAKHMSGVEVARALGTSPRHLAPKLSAVGIKPVIGPPECRQLFFDRKLAQDGVARLRNEHQ